jgi:hypothetical protein
VICIVITVVVLLPSVIIPSTSHGECSEPLNIPNEPCVSDLFSHFNNLHISPHLFYMPILLHSLLKKPGN